MIRRGYLRKILVVAGLLLIHPNPLTFTFGSAAVLLGALLHLWTKGCLVREVEVTTAGPYRLVRHPFYVANALVDAGICLMANTRWIYFIYPALFLVAYGRTILREEKFLAERHGEVWLNYRKRVPMFLPYRWPAPAAPDRGFRWENLMREKEIPRFIRLLAYPVLFHLWGAIITQGTHFWRVPSVGHILEGCLLIGLYVAAGLLNRALRARS